MTKNQHHNTHLQRIIALLVAVIEIFQTMKKYELICKRRNYHEPEIKDLDEFMRSDTTDLKNTDCVDCGCALQLSFDDENSEIFWIEEI